MECDFYRPQRSKVMFIHLCVILFTGGISVQGGLCPGGGGVCVQGGLCQGDPPQYSYVRVVRYPTGMHSCGE